MEFKKYEGYVERIKKEFERYMGNNLMDIYLKEVQVRPKSFNDLKST